MAIEHISICKHCTWVKVLTTFQVRAFVSSHTLYIIVQMQK